MRIEQGIPNIKRAAERASARRPTEAGAPQPDSLGSFLSNVLEKNVVCARSQARKVELLEQILEKLEEIRYGLVDNETGISNLLRQMKLSNRRLEELIDKRNS